MSCDSHICHDPQIEAILFIHTFIRHCLVHLFVIAIFPSTYQYIKAFRHGQDQLLKFKLSIRRGDKK